MWGFSWEQLAAITVILGFVGGIVKYAGPTIWRFLRYAALIPENVSCLTEEAHIDSLLLSVAMEEIGLAINWADREGNVTNCNALYLRWTGLTKEQVMRNAYVDIVHPDERGLLFDKWHTAVEARGEIMGQVRILFHDGEYRRVTYHSYPIHGDGWVSVMTIDEDEVSSQLKEIRQDIGELLRRVDNHSIDSKEAKGKAEQALREIDILKDK